MRNKKRFIVYVFIVTLFSLASINVFAEAEIRGPQEGVPKKSKTFWGDSGVPKKSKTFWGDSVAEHSTKLSAQGVTVMKLHGRIVKLDKPNHIMVINVSDEREKTLVFDEEIIKLIEKQEIVEGDFVFIKYKQENEKNVIIKIKKVIGC